MKKFLCLFCYFLLLSNFALAQQSVWHETIGGKYRVHGANSSANNSLANGGNIIAGIEIVLEKGWKTYWKNSGQSGIAPQLSFEGSKNIKDISLQLPVPKFFKQDGAIGYENNVVFIVNGKKIKEGENSILRVGGLIGVCEKICVPVELDLELEIKTKKINSKNQIINEALKQLPKASHEKIKIKSAKIVGENLIVKTSSPTGGNKQLFVGIQASVAKQTGRNEFAIDNFNSKKNLVDFLFVHDNMAIEQTLSIDRSYE